MGEKIKLTIKGFGVLSEIGRPYILCDPHGDKLWQHFCTDDDWARVDLINRCNRLEALNEKYGVDGWFLSDTILEVW